MEPSGDALTAQLRRMTEAQARVQDDSAVESEAPPEPSPPESSTEPPATESAAKP